MDGMAEAENDGPKSALNDSEPVASMTFWEKVGFFFFPTGWALIAAPLLLIAAFLLVGFTVAFVLHPHLFKQDAYWLREGASWLLLLAAVCAVFGAILVYPVRFFRKMRTRKRKTGSVFPSGDDLIAFRHRWEHPPLWMRILVVAFFCLIAFRITYEVIMAPGHRALVAWSVPGLFWLIAIAAIADALWPREERLWTSIVGSGAFGALTIMAVVAVIRHGYHGALDWIIPLLLACFSVPLGVIAIRDTRRRMRGAAANQAPRI